jgi:hypothetical protein
VTNRLLGQRVADLRDDLNALFLERLLVSKRRVLRPGLRPVIFDAGRDALLAGELGTRRPEAENGLALRQELIPIPLLHPQRDSRHDRHLSVLRL